VIVTLLQPLVVHGTSVERSRRKDFSMRLTLYSGGFPVGDEVRPACHEEDWPREGLAVAARPVGYGAEARI
jgi:hypothetical protein